MPSIEIGLALCLASIWSACSGPGAPEPVGPRSSPSPPEAAAPAPEVPPARGPAAVEPPSEPIEWLVLDDIQGLFGGRALYVAGDGAVALRVVRPEERGLRERRFEARWPGERMGELQELLARHGVATMVVPERPGIPDEALARLRVRWRSGREHEVSKWESDRHAGFDEVYGRLMGWLEESAADGRPTFEGAYDSAWSPPGPWQR